MRFDCVIQGARVADGTGHRLPYPADVGIVRDRIAAVGDLGGSPAQKVIEAHGRVISPGFIDVHVHSEFALLGGRDQMAGVRQGVTTQLLSPDGFGWAPLDARHAREMWRYTQFAYGEAAVSPDWPRVEDYLERFPGHTPVNVCPQVPHGAVCLRTKGWDAGPATRQELDAMVDTVREWMEAGAVSISCGLDYQPGAHASLDELVALAKVVGSYGGVYAAHIRKQALGVRQAWQETLEIGRRAQTAVHISHERVDEETAELLLQADREGIDLSFESYLYPAGMSHISILLPVDVQSGRLGDMLRRMRSAEVRERSLAHLRGKLATARDPIIGYTGSGRYIGMTLSEAAEAADRSREEFAYDLILEEEGTETWVIPWMDSERESQQILRRTAIHPRSMIASDGIYDIPHPHPRGYGCFVQVLGRFVRELGALSLEQAVRKMSGFPAERFGLRDRGQIAVGMAADLVVFDPGTVGERSTWQEPLRPAVGIDWVLVNGEIVIQDGAPTGRLPGRVLHRLTG